MVSLINSRAVDLPDSDRLVHQLGGLEHRTTRSGKDSIDHEPGAHDDLANAVALVLHLVHNKHPGWGRNGDGNGGKRVRGLKYTTPWKDPNGSDGMGCTDDHRPVSPESL
jgi:hypothetical protein